MSKLLVGCVIGAIAATGAMAATVAFDFPETPGPPPPGMPIGPPPNLQAVGVLTVVTGLFVLAWLAVLAVFARDQVLQRLREDRADPTGPGQIKELLDDFRAELAAEREHDLQTMSERLLEYGERRETDGYLHGMRVAAGEPADANVHPIRRAPGNEGTSGVGRQHGPGDGRPVMRR